MLLCLTANHRNTSFDLLTRLSTAAPEASAELVSSSDFVVGAVILATCNRFEAYLDLDDPLPAAGTLAVEETIGALERVTGVPAGELRDSVAVLGGDRVAHHLFSVSSGLESIVVGENEIAGQVRRAFESARESGTTSAPLERLFQRAARTSRDVRGAVPLHAVDRSLVSVALELAASRIADWSSARVLVVGTGRYAATTITSLKRRGAENITVFSSTGRADAFAARFGIRPAHDLATAIADAELVITCTARYTVSAADIPEGRRLVIDLGMPRNVDVAVARVPGVEVLDLELLKMHAPLPELAHARDAEDLVGGAARSFSAERAVAPSIVALRAHVERVLEAELERVRARGGDERAEEALRHFAGVIMHTPSVRAREAATDGRLDDVVRGLETLFGLEVPTAAPEAVRDESA